MTHALPLLRRSKGALLTSAIAALFLAGFSHSGPAHAAVPAPIAR